MNIKFTMCTINSNQWHHYFNNLLNSNLQQSWSYGNAKAASEKWRVQRWIVYKDKQPIALIQVLIKNICKLWSFARVNKGPLWIQEDKITEEEKAASFQLLHQQYNWKNRFTIIISPNLSVIAGNKYLLSNENFYSLNKSLVGTIWLDLRLSQEKLRKNLRNNWRGQLAKAEKKELICEIVHASKDMICLMTQYALLQQYKGFSGLPSSLMKQLINQDNNDFFQSILFKAITNTEVIAGVLVIRHGLTCTYLIGWFDREKGKGSNASNFLLWSAILEMKQRGCLWFDLGGISEASPALTSITSFKRGMGGEEYWLLGEYIAL